MDAIYFEQIPEWTAGSPSFTVLADKISGRIPVTRIENWKTLADALDDSFFNRNDQQVFRGHRRCDWGLTPSLARLSTASVISRECADRQLELFRLAVRGRLADTRLVDDGQEDELWSVGQHHGLQSPLLDWTYSPYVAVFFAFEKEDAQHESDNPYRAVYVLNKSAISNDHVCPEIRVIEPRQDEYGRLVNQAGLFTYSPYDETIESYLINTLAEDEQLNIDLDDADTLANYVCKLYIANEDRDGCLRHLKRMNVHHASLFPDLLGASQFCNIQISDEEQSRAEAVKSQEAEREAHQPEEGVLQPSLDTGEPTDLPILLEILKAPDGAKQVEPARLEVLADEINAAISKHLVVDWEERESAQARLRNIARITMRKYGYPSKERAEIIERIIGAFSSTEHDEQPNGGTESVEREPTRSKKKAKKKSQKKKQ